MRPQPTSLPRKPIVDTWLRGPVPRQQSHATVGHANPREAARKRRIDNDNGRTSGRTRESGNMRQSERTDHILTKFVYLQFALRLLIMPEYPPCELSRYHFS